MKNFKKILRTVLNETLGKSKSMEMEEMFDSDEIKSSRDGKGYDKYEFKGRVRPKELMKDFDLDSTSEDEFEYRYNTKDIELNDLFDPDDDSDPYIKGDDEPITEGEMCECGGMMKEGECMECGSMYEDIYDESKSWGKKTQSFDYIEEEYEESDEDVLDKYCDKDSDDYDKQRCEYHKNITNKDSINEAKKKLNKLQKNKIDKNKNGKIDSEDFKILRGKKKGGETNEKFPDLSGDGKVTKKDILMGRGVKLGKKKSKVQETIEYHIVDRYGDIIKLTEEETVDFIENIVNEEKKEKLKTIGKPKGLTTYEKAHKGSGKENDEYLKSVTKKMNDYLKDGSKGKFDMNPKMFPKGNGELGKMDKKAFKMTDDLEDFDYEIAGLNLPTPDAIEFNDEWMNDLYMGSSRTGNAPGGNALDSDTNERFNKLRKKNTLKKLKDQSYKRAPQPIFNEKVGSEKGKGLNIKLESYQREEKMINEEFDRIKELLQYNRKTQ